LAFLKTNKHSRGVPDIIEKYNKEDLLYNLSSVFICQLAAGSIDVLTPAFAQPNIYTVL
jgi:hypothetical protein